MKKKNCCQQIEKCSVNGGICFHTQNSLNKLPHHIFIASMIPSSSFNPTMKIQPIYICTQFWQQTRSHHFQLIITIWRQSASKIYRTCCSFQCWRRKVCLHVCTNFWNFNFFSSRSQMCLLLNVLHFSYSSNNFHEKKLNLKSLFYDNMFLKLTK